MTRFAEEVLEWYDRNGRDFHWRTTDLSAFEVLITEVCLRRTTPESVENDIRNILEELDGPKRVRGLNIDHLEVIFRPLGLQSRRAAEMAELAEDLRRVYDDTVPEERDRLMEIHGVGPYIADAIRCFGFGHPAVVVDPNVSRVAEHYLDVEVEDYSGDNEAVREALEPHVPQEAPQRFNWGLIDIGTDLKRGSNEACPDCPLEHHDA